MHKGMGAIATVLVQNGTLKLGDAFVFGQHWGRIKTMHDEYGRILKEAGPSTPVEITGFQVCLKPAKSSSWSKAKKKRAKLPKRACLACARPACSRRRKSPWKICCSKRRKTSKKILNIVLRADVQGSLEALENRLVEDRNPTKPTSISFSPAWARSPNRTCSWPLPLKP